MTGTMTSTDCISVRRLLSGDSAAFGRVVEIYTDSIAASGRKPLEQFRRMLEREDYRFLVAELEGRVIGFAVLFLARSAAVALLEYLAVAEGERGRGTGAALFQHAVEGMERARPGATMLLEVDSDRLADADQDLRRRRQAFYRRLGCRRIEGLAYRLPLPGPQHEMNLLMWSRTPVESVRREELVRWLALLYEEVYGRPEDDPRLGMMSESLPAVVRVV